MTITLDMPDLMDELEAQSLAERYTCVACGRIRCKCGRQPAETDAKPPKADNMDDDLAEDEPALTLPEWVELHRHEPINLATLPVPAPAGPWFSDALPEDVGDDWPHGQPAPSADPGRPNAEERRLLAVRARW